MRKQTAQDHATTRGSCSHRTANAWIPLAVKASSKSGIAVRGDDAGAGLEACAKSGEPGVSVVTAKLAWTARTLIVTARARSRVDLLFIREPTSSAEDRAPGVRWCRERLLRWRTNESLD